MAVLPTTTAELVLRPVDDLLASNEDMVARIKLSFGHDRATFDREVMPLVRAYADYVHWLPATPSDFFDRPGGLFRLGLETAFYAVQGTDAHIFAGRLTITARRHLEPRWRQATFIAGLGGELHRALGQVEVLDKDGLPWPAYLLPLARWLEQRDPSPCRLRWRINAAEARSQSLLALPHLVSANWWQHLAEDNDVIVPHLLACVGALPLYRGRNVLDELVRRAFALVVERDLLAHPRPGDLERRGEHQVRYLVEGLQRLITDDLAWRPNQDKSRVWYGPDGLFLIWPGAAHDLNLLLEGEQIAGMPDAPETILARLRAAGLIESQSEQEPLWNIRPPGTNAPLAAIKLASPAMLLAELQPAPAPLAEPVVPAPRSAAPPHTNTEQLPLIASGSAPPPNPPVTPNPERWQIKAPLRLNAGVRHALAAALAEPSEDIVCLPGEQGLFVPLQLFEAHRIAPALAIRALSEVGMLQLDSAEGLPTVQRKNAAGDTISGVRLKSRFIEPTQASDALGLTEKATC